MKEHEFWSGLGDLYHGFNKITQKEFGVLMPDDVKKEFEKHDEVWDSYLYLFFRNNPLKFLFDRNMVGGKGCLDDFSRKLIEVAREKVNDEDKGVSDTTVTHEDLFPTDGDDGPICA